MEKQTGQIDGNHMREEEEEDESRQEQKVRQFLSDPANQVFLALEAGIEGRAADLPLSADRSTLSTSSAALS